LHENFVNIYVWEQSGAFDWMWVSGVSQTRFCVISECWIVSVVEKMCSYNLNSELQALWKNCFCRVHGLISAHLQGFSQTALFVLIKCVLLNLVEVNIGTKNSSLLEFPSQLKVSHFLLLWIKIGNGKSNKQQL
jgi:hypothetical protein